MCILRAIDTFNFNIYTFTVWQLCLHDVLTGLSSNKPSVNSANICQPTTQMCSTVFYVWYRFIPMLAQILSTLHYFNFKSKISVCSITIHQTTVLECDQAKPLFSEILHNETNSASSEEKQWDEHKQTTNQLKNQQTDRQTCNSSKQPTPTQTDRQVAIVNSQHQQRQTETDRQRQTDRDRQTDRQTDKWQ